MTLEETAKTIRLAAYSAYRMALYSSSDFGSSVSKRMGDPVVGDLVIETSTVFSTCRPHLDAVGTLLRVEREEMQVPGWDQEEDGPLPTEVAYYLRLLDGTEFRWVNASFAAVSNCASSIFKG